jgi:hypothetical protein
MTLVDASGDAAPYEVVLETTPALVQPATPFTMTLTVRHPRTGETVSAFELVHDMWFHLFIVSRDMQEFQHLHPDMQPDGSWTIDVVLPDAGGYEVLSEFVPVGGLPQFITRSLTTAGGTDTAVARPELSKSFQTAAGDLTALLRMSPEQPVAGAPTQIVYTLTDTASGQPVENLEPYLGAFGHSFVVREGLTDYVHTHPVGDETRLSRPRARGGPDVVFDVVFGQPGRYRAWTQFQRNGQVRTVSFTFDVK